MEPAILISHKFSSRLFTKGSLHAARGNEFLLGVPISGAHTGGGTLARSGTIGIPVSSCEPAVCPWA